MELLKPLLLLFLAGVIDAFVYSCDEVKAKLMNSNFEHRTTFACVFAQEGYSNWKQLNMIHFDGHSRSMEEIASSRCERREVDDAPWKITADSGLRDLKCDQEFSFVFTSTDPAFWTPLKQVRQTQVSAINVPQQIFVVPQTKMWLQTVSCTGAGNVTFWTGAGVDEGEKRFLLKSFSCSDVPRIVYTFDTVVTITADGDVEYSVQHSTNMGTSSKPPFAKVNYGDHLTVFTSGRSDNLQNRKGISDNRAYINIGEKHDVNVELQIILDPVNTGSVQLMKKRGFRVDDYYTGITTERFNTDYFEVRYSPSSLQPQQIWNSRDNVIVDIYIGPKPLPATTTASPTTTTTTTAAPTTTAEPLEKACRTCAPNLITLTTDNDNSHAFDTDATEMTSLCVLRTLTCVGPLANIEINDGEGVIDGSAYGHASIVVRCNAQGTAWVYAGVPITQLECASG